MAPGPQTPNDPVNFDDITTAIRDELELLTVHEVAALMKVKTDWIYDQVQAGKFPVVKMGRLRRFRPSDVAAYLRGEWSATPTPRPTELVQRRRGRPRKTI